MNYCSHCGSDQIFFEVPQGDNLCRHICRNCGRIHYANPKVVVGCLPFYEDKVMLCKRAIYPRIHLWNLPAGFLENGETVEQGALREVYEETEANIEILHLHCIYNIPHANQLYIHFLARLLDLDYADQTQESAVVQLFRKNEIPWDHIAFSSTTFALEKYFEYLNTDFKGVHIGTHNPASLYSG